MGLTLRQWIEHKIARLSKSDVGARQDRAELLARLLAEFDRERGK